MVLPNAGFHFSISELAVEGQAILGAVKNRGSRGFSLREAEARNRDRDLG